MKKLTDYTSGKTFKAEVVKGIEDIPRYADFVTSLLDEKTMERYKIYQDSDGFYYAINEDEE